jgi:hypothetical protein
VRRIGELVRVFLAGRLTGEEERVATLVTACREVLGEAGGHARVRDIRGHSLVLEMDHPGWAQLVAMRKGDILRHLAMRAPWAEIRELRLIIGGPAERPSQKARIRRSTGAGKSKPSLPVEGIRDERLRRALSSLYDQAETNTEESGAERGRIDSGEKPGV